MTANALPVVLPSAPISFLATDAAGTTRSAQPGIRNTDSVGVLIDQISFTALSTVSNTPTTSLLVELRYRNQPLTSSYVCLAGISWPQNEGVEDPSHGDVATIRFADPMYLAPGEFIDVSIRNDLVPLNVMTVNVVATGRQAPEPAKRYLPFLCSYLGPAYAPGAAISDQSAATDLMNPFPVPLRIERMIGRIANNPYTYYSFQPPDAYWLDFSARIYDNHDRYWVSGPVPLPAIFDTNINSWPVNTRLGPRDFLHLEFEGTLSAAAQFNYLACVGFVGSREI